MARRQDSLVSDNLECFRNDLQERDVAFLEDDLMERERNSDTDQSLEPSDCDDSEKDPTYESGTNGRTLEQFKIEYKLKLES